MTASTLRIPVKTTQLRPLIFRRVFGLLLMASLLLLSGVGQAQRKNAPPAEETALFQDYRGVQLGMLADEVRKKLGDPRDKSDEQDFFVFGENESAQIVYDPTHKVITISVDFLGTDSNVPTAKQVFGSEVGAKADHSVYKMVRFEKAGYWLSYNRTASDSPMTSITLQKIQ